MQATAQRKIAVDLFNHVWDLMLKPDRTQDEDDEMLHAAHASRYHWGAIGKPENRARGEWQVSRAYTVLGRGGAALYHANRCLEICEKYGIGDWDRAYAYEALSRANRVARHAAEAGKFRKLAREWGDRIKDREDRQHFEKDYATL
jgi:hypothetical protein